MEWTDKSMRIAGCGCLLGILLGILYAAASIFSGFMREPRVFLLLIPLFGLFCGGLPMTFLSPDKGLRIGAGCFCYPLLLFTIALSSVDQGSRPIAWGGLVLLLILVLAGVIAGAVRKHRG